MPLCLRACSLAALLVAIAQPPPAADRVITAKMHHLRSGGEREWAEFSPAAEGSELAITFQVRASGGERTLRLRHRDLKAQWQVLLNGRDVARLPTDEADMITYWAVPPGSLAEGTNELRIGATGKVSDDVLIGEVSLIDRPRAEVLSAGTLHVAVREEASGRALPARITITDVNGTLVQPGNESGGGLAVRPGVVYTGTGDVRLQLPAGRYVVHAGRGFEYSVARADVAVTPGSSASRQLAIRREVDTSGWLAMDTHVHTATFARHGDATIEERMLTIAGEGIELPVSTEHNTYVDFDRHAREADVRGYFTPVTGSEVTTPSIGHFNVFPIAPNAVSIDYKALDWPALRTAVVMAAADPVIVLNHGRDVHGGFRPLDPVRHISVAGEHLGGTPLPANAMEILNSGAVVSDGLALARDWMGMLNRGLMLTPVGSSDSHDVSRYIVGQGRTYVRGDDGDPGRIDVARAIKAVRQGQVMVSYGLLTEIDVQGVGPGELVAAPDAVTVRIRVKGPGWTRAARVALFANGIKVREEAIAWGPKPGLKWEGEWRLPRPAHDVHLVAIATGPGIAAPYWPTAKPYQPTSIDFTPYVLGVSGAVFADADGSGTFESAFDYARREVSAGEARPLVERLAGYDSAVATQAASLLRARNPAEFEARIDAMIGTAQPHVRQGLLAYLEAWKERQARLDTAERRD